MTYPTNATFRQVMTAFGVRELNTELSAVFVPVMTADWSIMQNLTITGADATTAVIPSNSTVSAAVDITEDVFLSSVGFLEPQSFTTNDVRVLEAALVRRNPAGTAIDYFMFQGTPFQCGVSTLANRAWRVWNFSHPIEVRGGDFFAVSCRNEGANPTTTGATVKWRGFSTPPA